MRPFHGVYGYTYNIPIESPCFAFRVRNRWGAIQSPEAVLRAGLSGSRGKALIPQKDSFTYWGLVGNKEREYSGIMFAYSLLITGKLIYITR